MLAHFRTCTSADKTFGNLRWANAFQNHRHTKTDTQTHSLTLHTPSKDSHHTQTNKQKTNIHAHEVLLVIDFDDDWPSSSLCKWSRRRSLMDGWVRVGCGCGGVHAACCMLCMHHTRHGLGGGGVHAACCVYTMRCLGFCMRHDTTCFVCSTHVGPKYTRHRAMPAPITSFIHLHSCALS